MEIYHLIWAPMMSWTSEKRAEWSIPHHKKERRKDWLGEKKKIFPFGITSAGARGSFAPRDLMLSVKLTKLVWKKKKSKTSSFHPLPLHCSSPLCLSWSQFSFSEDFFLPSPLPFFLFFDADRGSGMGAWRQLRPKRDPAFLICIVSICTFSNYRICHKGPRRGRW